MHRRRIHRFAAAPPAVASRPAGGQAGKPSPARLGDRVYERPVVTDKGALADLTWAGFASLDAGFRPCIDER